MAIPDVSNIPGWLTPKEAAELHGLAAGRKCLEIGSFCGRSSVAIGTSAEHLHCIDPFDARGTPVYPQQTLTRFRLTLSEFGLSGRVSYTAATVEEWGAIWGNRQFDFCFIDGEHTAAALASNLETVHRMINPAGVVALHDYGNPEFPDVERIAHSFFSRKPDRLTDSLAVYLMDGPYPGRLLNVVTPSRRPENLPVIADSLARLRNQLPGWVVRWYVFTDRSIIYPSRVQGAFLCGRQSPGGASGNPGRNDALDAIRTGWVHFLDDDNDFHPNFAAGLQEAVANHPDSRAFIFPQYHADGRERFPANPEAGYAEVDSAQFLFHRGAIGPLRWDRDDYAADCTFFAAVSKLTRCVPIPSGGVYYNKLRG